MAEHVAGHLDRSDPAAWLFTVDDEPMYDNAITWRWRATRTAAKLPNVRLHDQAAAIVRAEFDDPYALARKRIATDGVAVFVRLADDSLVHARDKQGAIREVLDDYLRYVEWSEDGSPKRLRLSQYPSGAEVVIDPRFGWGAPVLDRNKVKYDLTESAVEDVLRQAA